MVSSQINITNYTSGFSELRIGFKFRIFTKPSLMFSGRKLNTPVYFFIDMRTRNKELTQKTKRLY